MISRLPLSGIAMLLAWLALFMVGSWGLWMRLATGHEMAAYGNFIPWGLWVVAYIYFSGISAGFLVLSAVAAMSRRRGIAEVAPLALFAAGVALVMGLLSIAMDLGHMNRAGQVILHANLRSIMAWMIFLYTLDFALVTVENVLALAPACRERRGHGGLKGFLARQIARIPEPLARRWLHRLGYLEIPLAIAFFGGVGALFATVSARGYWHNPLLPIIFVAGAVASASGAVALLYYLVMPRDDASFGDGMATLGRATLGLLLFLALLEWAQVSVPLWQGLTAEAQVFRSLMFGPFWWNFWIIHVFLGTLIPVLLLVFGRRRPRAIAAAGALVAVTFFSVRLNLVIPPQTQALIHGQAEAFVSVRNSLFYFPTFFEWAVLSFVLAVGSALFWLGLRFLPVVPETLAPERLTDSNNDEPYSYDPGFSAGSRPHGP